MPLYRASFRCKLYCATLWVFTLTQPIHSTNYHYSCLLFLFCVAWFLFFLSSNSLQIFPPVSFLLLPKDDLLIMTYPLPTMKWFPPPTCFCSVESNMQCFLCPIFADGNSKLTWQSDCATWLLCLEVVRGRQSLGLGLVALHLQFIWAKFYFFKCSSCQAIPRTD